MAASTRFSTLQAILPAFMLWSVCGSCARRDGNPGTVWGLPWPPLQREVIVHTKSRRGSDWTIGTWT